MKRLTGVVKQFSCRFMAFTRLGEWQASIDANVASAASASMRRPGSRWHAARRLAAPHCVYRPNTKAGEVYLKLTVIDDVLIVSFKEL